MATFTAQSHIPPVWMNLLPNDVSGARLTSTSSTVSFAAGAGRYAGRYDYHGSFTYVGDSIFGTLTSLSYIKSTGDPLYTVSDLSYDAQSISRHMTAGSHAELLPLLLSGDDVIVADVGWAIHLMGFGGNDTITGAPVVDGGDGFDTVVLNFSRIGVQIHKFIGGLQIWPNYTFKNVERLKFTDTAIAYDIEGNAGQAYRLYQAAFDRKPDLGGLGTWIGLMDKGMSLAEVSSYFQRSEEFKTLYGTSVTNEKFVDLLYQNVLDRLPDAGGYATWKGVLDAGTWTREQVLIGFSESTENQVKVIGSIQNGIEYQPSA